MDKAGRAQAAAAADALHKLNAPLEQLLAKHREFETSMADAAERLTALAAQLDAMAQTYAQLNRTLEQTVAPYLSYVEQLERTPRRGGPGGLSRFPVCGSAATSPARRSYVPSGRPA